MVVSLVIWTRRAFSAQLAQTLEPTEPFKPLWLSWLKPLSPLSPLSLSHDRESFYVACLRVAVFVWLASIPRPRLYWSDL